MFSRQHEQSKIETLSEKTKSGSVFAHVRASTYGVHLKRTATRLHTTISALCIMVVFQTLPG